MRSLFLPLIAVLLSTSVLAGQKNDPPAKAEPPVVLKSKYGPKDVEVKLQDGSVFRGELQSVDSVTFKTAYGVLTVPIADMLRVDRGERLTEKDSKEIAETIKDLDNDEFAKRSAAQYKLETFPPSAAEAIKAARDGASPESKSRIDGILKKLAAKNANRKIQTEDSCRTTRFEATGSIQFETLKLKTRLGELAVKLEDLQAIRWLNRGEQKTMTLEPNASMGEWVDTGIDSTPGDKLAVIVSGTINPFNNQDISPVGTDNWGNAGQFMMGAVVAKLGQTGDAFLLGYGKVLNTETKERLFVKINWNYNRTGRSNDGSKGHYALKISTGSWADDIDASSISQGQ